MEVVTYRTLDKNGLSPNRMSKGNRRARKNDGLTKRNMREQGWSQRNYYRTQMLYSKRR